MIKNDTRYNDLGESLNDASIDRLMAIDMNWVIIAWNKTAEQITGIAKKDILGKNLLEVFPQIEQDDEMMQGWTNALKGMKSFLPSNGAFNRNHYENHFIPLKDKEGALFGALNIMHDVAHRIKAEKQLEVLNAALKLKYEQLQKVNSELATFTSITSTELKEPIKHIYTGIEFILTKDGPKLSDSSKAGLRRVQGSLNRINLLLDDILSLSTAGSFSGEFKKTNLNEVVKNVLNKLQPKIIEKKAIIDVADLPSIYGSPEMLEYLFYNIIDNSLKFQQRGNIPRINISGSPSSHRDTGIDLLCISISDNGIGFLPENKEKIFRMFERLDVPKHFHGSGIGLTISQKIAEAHDGYIEAESEPGKGTTMHCYLATSLPGHDHQPA